ncbi:MAG: hypothetical protein GY714_18060 [Desulfobacterales bacterium]|nr:hypothetical protein [Desulfobacterales bacterium]
MAKRKERVGLGMYKKEMTIPTGLVKKGYVPRWINDDGDRIEVARNGGYDYVYDNRTEKTQVGEKTDNGNSDIGSKISRIVDKSARLGAPMRAYLMQIKKEYYDEDQKAKMAKVDEMDNVIKHGKNGIDKKDSGDFYAEMNYKT